MSKFSEKFDKVFIEGALDDPLNAIAEVCNYVKRKTPGYSGFELGQGITELEIAILMDAHDLVGWIVQFSNLEETIYNCNTTDEKENFDDSRECLLNFFQTIKPALFKERKQAKYDKYNHISSKGFAYHFSEEDVSRIQTLINELRDNINASNLFEDEHKQRLLKRLEKLQAEMHKKMSDVDKLWGFVGDAGIVFGKFGKDVQPIVDRIKEITQITWNTQAKAEGLPDGEQHLLFEK